ncbi:hypothetical protein Asera_00770 [Actinocatenispora sera]|uniref:Uncharacterized protein n=1 Tax=Actinocatenispora sera TaxID=390989 RepID=A0A810KUE0_9ACTN|nr:hypothetical protein Asera_00770 [Actinocatenispora sera]
MTYAGEVGTAKNRMNVMTLTANSDSIANRTRLTRYRIIADTPYGRLPGRTKARHNPEGMGHDKDTKAYHMRRRPYLWGTGAVVGCVGQASGPVSGKWQATC